MVLENRKGTLDDLVIDVQKGGGDQSFNTTVWIINELHSSNNHHRKLFLPIELNVQMMLALLTTLLNDIASC